MKAKELIEILKDFPEAEVIAQSQRKVEDVTFPELNYFSLELDLIDDSGEFSPPIALFTLVEI